MLNGLILCGGESSRLGIPKFTIQKNGVPLYQYWIEQLHSYCHKIYISSKRDINYPFQHPFIIYDQKTGTGPLEGIYQAFKLDQDSNWLVVAVDLVYAGQEDIQALVTNQSDDMEAVCFENPDTKEPFPLLTIYNKSIFKNLKSEYNTDRKSAKQLLLHAKTRVLCHDNKFTTLGINTLEELKKWKSTETSN